MKWQTLKGYKIQRILTTNLPLIITNGDNNIMIDTGRKKAWNSISKKLDKVLGDNKINAVILTHTHPDHTQTLNQVVCKYDCKVLVYEKVVNKVCLNKKENFVLVNDEYELNDLGIEGKIIYIPGHSEGSIGIIVDDVIMIGDIMGDFVTKPFAKKKKRVSDDTLKSLKKLVDQKCKLYFPAHKERVYTYEQVENFYNRYIEGEIIYQV
ncbi:MBL fold metallo-hydrolase [Oceanirhabdus sp. W0125-5]|uniref:MBL fold metallo-hydrolase n=1 Tax=Oceanirhabdus sp. W0125-5 TaxID=2999116 RepID=UPI0022F2B4CC|nr:MBL fold metallo-hydrolase [Oceanirhabdus sp. W0125-5]WBW99401.1 MBL fold metallo-hydrolase [Oceanirhabdus sp. W0125-5]